MELVLVSLVSSMVIIPIFMLAYLWARSKKFYSAVDLVWVSAFGILAITFAVTTDINIRTGTLYAMFLAWSIRLGYHLFMRLRALFTAKKEDARYADLLERWHPHSDRNFMYFYFAQGLSVILLAAPLFIVMLSSARKLGLPEGIGIALWLVGFFGEAIADKQLKDFVKDPANKGEVCQKGLWNYSRHPNYFFEWLMWWGYFFFALPSDLGWFAILSPLIMLFLLVKLTGIPYAEASSLQSKGDKFRKYQKTTSEFVPLPKKG